MPHTSTIPQAVFTHYNACYNNQTFHAFSLAAARALDLDERVGRLEAYDETHHRLTSLLLDTSLELSGAEFYAGAGQRLGDALGDLDNHTPALLQRAIDHLTPFATGDHTTRAREKIAHLATLALAEYARRTLVRALDHAALLPGWRGTSPYYLLLAAAQIVQSAEIVLRGDPSASYLLEKLTGSIRLLGRGTGEIVYLSGNPHPAMCALHAQISAIDTEIRPRVCN